jgi:hypothetical protein
MLPRSAVWVSAGGAAKTVAVADTDTTSDHDQSSLHARVTVTGDRTVKRVSAWLQVERQDKGASAKRGRGAEHLALTRRDGDVMRER